MTKPVVSDTGPLITLAKLNLLHLLERLYRRVYFPGSVYKEAVVEGLRQGLEDTHTLRLFCIISIIRGNFYHRDTESTEFFIFSPCSLCLCGEKNR